MKRSSKEGDLEKLFIPGNAHNKGLSQYIPRKIIDIKGITILFGKKTFQPEKKGKSFNWQHNQGSVAKANRSSASQALPVLLFCVLRSVFPLPVAYLCQKLLVSFSLTPSHSAKSWRWCLGWTSGSRQEAEAGGKSSLSNFLKSKISGCCIDSLLRVGLIHPGSCVLYYCRKQLLPVLLRCSRRPLEQRTSLVQLECVWGACDEQQDIKRQECLDDFSVISMESESKPQGFCELPALCN